MSFLGHFANDNEIRLLLKTYIVNLFDSNPAIRRTTAVCITSIGSHCQKPNFFLPWLLGTLLDFIVPINASTEETPTNRILGILLCTRHLVPAISSLPSNIPDLASLHERCLQLYELTLHFLDHSDHNIVTHSLETLQQLLKTPPQVHAAKLHKINNCERPCINFKNYIYFLFRLGSQRGFDQPYRLGKVLH